MLPVWQDWDNGGIEWLPTMQQTETPFIVKFFHNHKHALDIVCNIYTKQIHISS